MRTFTIIATLCWSLSCAAFDVTPPLPDAAQQALYERLINELRCLQCQNETIAESNAELAADLRREVRELVAQGQSEIQIKDFLTSRYGDFVLYRPRTSGPTLVLWLLPGLLVAIGAFALMRIVRRRATLPVPEADDPAS